MKTSINKTWKKAVGILGAATILTVSITSCEDKSHKDDDVESFRVFVTDLSHQTKEEVKENWGELEKEYEEKVAVIDKKKDHLEDNIEEEYEQLKKDYNEMKADIKAEMETEENQHGHLHDLYNTILTNEGDMDLSAVNATNIEGIYSSFVAAVDLHKDDYTREDWDEVDVLWDALNKRKNEVEDNLTSMQKVKIGEEKVKYGAYKSVNKLPAKSEEKRAASK